MIVRICGLLFMLLIASGTFSQTDPFRSSEISISLNDIYEVDVEEGKARINIDIMLFLISGLICRLFPS